MGEPVRLLSFNVRHAALDEGDAWVTHRRDAVAALLRDQRPAVVALQEAGPDQLGELAERVPGYEWAGAGERTGQYNPVGHRAADWSRRSLSVRWLSETPDEVSAGWDAAFPRVATVAEFAADDGRAFTLFDVHFDHRGETAGVESARLVREWVADRDGPVVVAGDLNCTPDGEPYRLLTAPESPLRDARAAAARGHRGPDVTFTGYGPVADGRRLDYVLVTGDVSVERHAVHPGRDAEGRPLSDHLPLSVAFTP